MTNETKIPEGDAVGVQNLIDKLKSDGVSKGREEADRLVAEARAKAMSIIDQSREESQELLANARKEAEQIEANGREALRLAGRDAVLHLKEQLQQEFKHRLSTLIGRSLKDPELIRRMILEITSGTMHDSGTESKEGQQSMRLLVSGGSDPESNQQLDALVQGLSADMLSDGVQLNIAGDPHSGIRVKLVEQDVEIELTETALTSWLMRFLAPRFRSIIESSR